MVSRWEKKEPVYFLMALLVLTGMVAGCADSGSNHAAQPVSVDEPRAVVGDSPKDRASIEAANQQIYSMEHVASPDPSTITTAPPSPDIPYGAAPAASPDASSPPGPAASPASAAPDTSGTNSQ